MKHVHSMEVNPNACLPKQFSSSNDSMPSGVNIASRGSGSPADSEDVFGNKVEEEEMDEFSKKLQMFEGKRLDMMESENVRLRSEYIPLKQSKYPILLMNIMFRNFREGS